MIISGPAEWSEALLATGVKTNLLQNGAILCVLLPRNDMMQPCSQLADRPLQDTTRS